MDGEVVGINSAKLASTAVEGMGYAIAISDVTDILENLMNETARNNWNDEDTCGTWHQGQTVDSRAVQLYGYSVCVMYTRLWMEVLLRRLA